MATTPGSFSAFAASMRSRVGVGIGAAQRFRVQHAAAARGPGRKLTAPVTFAIPPTIVTSLPTNAMARCSFSRLDHGANGSLDEDTDKVALVIDRTAQIVYGIHRPARFGAQLLQ